MPPKFTHDCEACKFHGHMQGHDVYTCQSSFVLRYGNDGPEYQSLPKTMVPDIITREGGASGLFAAAVEFIGGIENL